MSYPLIKALHIISMVTWFGGMFYLPRLFVYHANTQDALGKARFVLMEKKLYGLCHFGAILTLFFGGWLWLGFGISGYWLYAKLVLVGLLLAYHAYCGVLVRRFAQDKNCRSHVWYRFFNEIPVVILIGAVLLVVLKPF